MVTRDVITCSTGINHHGLCLVPPDAVVLLQGVQTCTCTLSLISVLHHYPPLRKHSLNTQSDKLVLKARCLIRAGSWTVTEALGNNRCQVLPTQWLLRGQ